MSDNNETGCHSSVVEHCFGKAEVDSSILSDSTIYSPEVENRFLAKVKAGASLFDCWEWQASFRKDGYGQFKAVSGASPIGAHVVAWELWHRRPAPEGLCILHSCDNPKCCNPMHLWAGTHKQNGEDKAKKGRAYKGGPGKRTVA